MRLDPTLLAGAALLALAGATPAQAEETTCRGFIGPRTVDDLRVADGTRCRLQGTLVGGSIVVGSGASLAAAGVDVLGNVQAEAARKVRLADSTVAGSVQLVQGGAAIVVGTQIDGDLLLDGNGRIVKARRNLVGGNLQAFQNTGGVVLRGNDIGGNLQCTGNAPAPRGGGNVTGGIAQDQCTALDPGDGGVGTLPPIDPGCVFGPVSLDDDFEIPAGVGCAMDGTRVAGSVKLNPGASLDAIDVIVDGNIQAEGAAGLAVVGSDVQGSIQFERGGSVLVQDTTIAGSLQLVSNDGPLLAIDNRIGGDLQAFENRGGPEITFVGNVIDGNLQCKQNVPRPGGIGNLVGGNAEDQCARL